MLQIVSELDIGRCASDETEPKRRVHTRRCASKELGPEEVWIVRSTLVGEENEAFLTRV